MHKPIPYLFIISLGLLATSCSTMNSPSAAGVDLRNTYLTVHLQNGTAGVNQKNYKPTVFKVANNTCSITQLNFTDGSGNVGLQVCYLGNTLYLDPDNAEKKSTKDAIRFQYTPIWQRGFTYTNIHTNGVAKLNNSSVSLRLENTNANTTSTSR